MRAQGATAHALAEVNERGHKVQLRMPWPRDSHVLVLVTVVERVAIVGVHFFSFLALTLHPLMGCDRDWGWVGVEPYCE